MITKLPAGIRLAALASSLIILVASTASPARSNEQIAVVATLPPIHGLVEAVMGEVGTSILLMQASASPHAATLKPSGARALEDADIVFWIGPELETSLIGAMTTLSANALMVPLIEADGLIHRAYRDLGPRGLDDDGHAPDTHNHDHDHDHLSGAEDQHIWLDPVNARAIVRAIAAALIATDPANQHAYTRNAIIAKKRLNELSIELADTLKPVRSIPIVVFHDAYQHLEARFDINVVDAVTVNPNRRPGAARVAEIRQRIRDKNAGCVFVEPQFEPGLAPVLVEGTEARIAQLDPLGVGLVPGPDLYFELMRRNARALLTCLSGSQP